MELDDVGRWDADGGPVPRPAMDDPNLGTGFSMVHGGESRIEVASRHDLGSFPWQCHCHLTISHGGLRRFATGWQIGPRTVITAGHCLYSGGAGANAVHLRFADGSDAVLARELRCSRGWLELTNPVQASLYDYGAVFLEPGDARHLPQYLEPRTVGPASVLAGLVGIIAGFPNSHPGVLMYHWERLDFAEHALTYRIDTSAGNSGSPILVAQAAGYAVVGIHIEGSPIRNFGIRMRPTMIELFERWRDSPPN